MTLRSRFRKWGQQSAGVLMAVAGIWDLPFAALAQAPAGPAAAATAPEVPDAPRRAAVVSPTRYFPIMPTDSAALRRRRRRLLVGGTALSYGVLYTGLATAWYTGERVPLHWFNDLPEWQQLDKCGHFWGRFRKAGAWWICCAGPV